MDTAATLDQYTQDISNLPAELQHILAELGTSDGQLYEIRKRISQKDSSIHKFIKQHGSLTKNPKEAQLYPKIREDFVEAEKLQKEKVVAANTALFLTAKHLVKLEGDMEKLRAEGLLVVEDMDIDLDEELFSSRNSTRANTEGLGALSGIGAATTPQLANAMISSAAAAASAAATASQMTTSASTSSAYNAAQKKVSRKAVKSQTPTMASAVRPLKRQRTDELKTPEPQELVTVAQLQNMRPGGRLQTPKMQGSPADANTTKGEDDELYCFCQRVSFGEMVGCDNDDCKYEWFHYECVGLKEPPKGKWYCSDCLAKMKNGRDKKKRKQ